MIALLEPQPLLAAHLERCIRQHGLETVAVEDSRCVVLFVDAPVAGWAERVADVASFRPPAVVLTALFPERVEPQAWESTRVHVLPRPFTPEQLRDALIAVGAMEVSDESLLGIDESDVLEEIAVVEESGPLPDSSSTEAVGLDDAAALEAAANEALAEFRTEAMESAVDDDDVIDEIEPLPAFSNPVVHEATMRLARTIAGEVEAWSTFSGEERVRTVYAFLAAYARGET